MRLAALTTAIISVGMGTVVETAKASKSQVANVTSVRATSQTQHRWWNMVENCEARGLYDPWYADTGNGFFFGPQFTSQTWHAYGGGPVQEMGDRGGRPMHAYSIAYIINVAERVLRGQGFGAWPNCYGYL